MAKTDRSDVAPAQQIVVFEQQLNAARPYFDAVQSRLNFERECEFARSIAQKSDYLLGAFSSSPETLLDSLRQLASLDLSLNPALQQAALVPRWNSSLGRMTVTLMPMYRGYLKLATDEGMKGIKVGQIHECDEYEVEEGSRGFIKVRPNLKLRPSSPVLAYYCIAFFNDIEIVSVLLKSDADKIASKSDAYNPKPRKSKNGGTYTPDPSGPWVDWYDQMAIKACIKRASKIWPLAQNSKLAEAIDIDNRAERAEWTVVDEQPAAPAAPTVVITKDEAVELAALIKDSGINEKRFLKVFEIETTEQLPAEKLKDAKDRLAAYKAAKAAAPPKQK